MISIVGYDILGNGSEGLRYAWWGDRFLPYVESAAFSNRSKGKCENISGYTTSVSSGCILKAQKNNAYSVELDVCSLSMGFLHTKK